MKIVDIYASEVIDSRGNPTVRANVVLENGIKASAIVPSGASTGKREALELRDGDKKRFLGKGVLKACKNVNTLIKNVLVGKDVFNLSLNDELMIKLDGTNNFANLGANATLGVSMAMARAGAKSLGIPLYKYLGGVNARILPTPMFNIINGGEHANNSIDFQEYMLVPVGFDKFEDALRACCEIYAHLKSIIDKNGWSTAVGDEGGFAPDLGSNEEAITLILEAIKNAGYKSGSQIAIALDVASSEFYNNGVYTLKSEGKKLNSNEMISYYENLCAKYPIISIEDGLDEGDWEGWSDLTKAIGDKVQLVGDDLFVTNELILNEGISKNIANSILIKPNQIGTITQTINTILLAQQNGYKCVMSHRSGESEDTFIADASVAFNCGQIKTGSTSRSERNAKYNRLLEINQDLEYLGKYLGGKSY
jgi:enolase